MTKRLPCLWLLFSATCAVAWAQSGAEFQVNSHTAGFQYGQAVVADANGSFVVVWASYGQDGSSWGVFGQRFDPAGVPQGSEFQINSYTTNQQWGPTAAADAPGNFVVVWQSEGQDGSQSGVFGQRFDAGGVPQGSEFQVNSGADAEGAQCFPAVTSDADGNFVVVWDSHQGWPSKRVFARRFNAAGIPQGGEFLVSDHWFGPAYPAVASDTSGNFVVVWNDGDGSGDGVFGRRFNAAGIPEGSVFQVNSYTASDQSLPAVASDANGDLVVVWSSDGQDGSGLGVFGQRFAAAGIPQGSEFRVNSLTTGHQDSAAVASDPNGNFLVAWNSFEQDGSSFGVFGQRFTAAGVPQGSGFRVNSHTNNGQDVPAVAPAGNGDFVVTWNSYGQDGSDWGVFGQRYGDVIFKNGFE